jgi:metal transporter CNNM
MGLITTFITVIILVIFSAICSGLNIGLMALDSNDLQRKSQLGNRAARRILPFRQRTHLALASILLSNIAVVSATSLVLEHQFNGLIAGIVSTLLIVIFGEVIPQALFAKNPLKLTSFFAPVLKVMIWISYPIAKPLQILLDRLVGHTPRQLPSRQELGMIITEQLGAPASELDEDEITIIRGALRLSLKQVRQVLTPIESVYWLERTTLLSGQRVDEIKHHGFSRIPIFNKQLTECYGLLLIKDLIDIDFDHKEYQIGDLPLHAVETIGSMTALDTVFRKFIGSHAHLMAVERDQCLIGVVTIEDVIEEIVGQEIEDENDQRKLDQKISPGIVRNLKL